uniref:Uncharacterized protein n=1 Tax=Sphaerulina musiva TaxID=85929 RepID=A0A0X7YHB4_9PEZI|nr:hypothetical protein [Sphaerulina musiva]AJF39626.1 hypothetical protein [Sphaerulina musiva]AJF39637.1 hypothetical protein [Sphaerulina musiva]AJF39662.1 hypothetical protein [Sphaerulina musiva]AJF39689.1 hypothetical protein [Sphaerulina musiva]
MSGTTARWAGANSLRRVGQIRAAVVWMIVHGRQRYGSCAHHSRSSAEEESFGRHAQNHNTSMAPERTSYSNRIFGDAAFGCIAGQKSALLATDHRNSR